VAKEHAFQKAAKSLLVGDNEEILPDDEAIFADNVVTDGDTQVANKFIHVQVSIIGPTSIPCVINLADQLPDVCHFIKTVSNALYDLKKVDSSYFGAGLLDAARIRAILANISRHICRHGKILKDNPNCKNDAMQKAIIDKSREKCLKAI
jgi:hypothetical protein